MGSYNTIETEVLARLGNRDDITSRIQSWINDAYFEILMAPRFKFFELEKQATAATLNTLRAYDLPSDLWHILDIRDYTSGAKLRRSHWSQFDKTTVTYGRPVRYARFGSTIELDPAPDGVYQLIIRYQFRPNELTTDSSTIVSREWDELITALAVAKGAEALELPERAAMHRKLFEQLASTRLSTQELEDMDAETAIAPRLE